MKDELKKIMLETLPAQKKSFGNQGVLTEAHFIEIYNLEIDFRLKNYVRQDQILQELAAIIVKRRFTTRQTKELVNKRKGRGMTTVRVFQTLKNEYHECELRKIDGQFALIKPAGSGEFYVALSLIHPDDLQSVFEDRLSAFDREMDAFLDKARGGQAQLDDIQNEIRARSEDFGNRLHYQGLVFNITKLLG